MLFERTKTLSSFLWHVSHFRQLRVSLSPDYEDNGYGDYDDDEQHDHCHNHSDRQSTQTRSLGLSARIVDALLPCRTAGLIVGQVRSGDDDWVLATVCTEEVADLFRGSDDEVILWEVRWVGIGGENVRTREGSQWAEPGFQILGKEKGNNFFI